MQLYERQPRESGSAFHAFSHFRDLGLQRSVDAAYRAHQQECQGVRVNYRRAHGRWRDWCRRFAWDERVAIYDAEQVATSCHAAGLEVQIVTPPDVPDKSDVSDYLKNHTKADLTTLTKATSRLKRQVGQPEKADLL